jgi:hypothetical protein
MFGKYWLQNNSERRARLDVAHAAKDAWGASSSALQSYRGRSLPANSRAAFLRKMLNWLPSRFEVALAGALLSAALVLAAVPVPRLHTF